MYLRGHHYNHAENVKKRNQTKMMRTEERRPLCACGCGKKTTRADAQYASVKCVPKPGASKEAMARISAMRDMEKLKKENAIRMTQRMKDLKDSGRLAEINKQHSERMKGRATTGKSEKGKPDHVAAKAWRFRDTNGRMHTFSNLREWARQNEHLFADDRPYSKLPFAERIASGMKLTLAKNGKVCSYRGWTAVSKQDFIEGGGDILGRYYFMQNK
jgi:hypothetical protein